MRSLFQSAHYNLYRSQNGNIELLSDSGYNQEGHTSGEDLIYNVTQLISFSFMAYKLF